MNATPVVYSAGVLRFYASGTSTPLSVYANSDLTSASTTITLNSAGRPSQDIFLSNVLYKVTLEDSLGNIIWTVDPYMTSDYSAYAQFYSYPGSPSGLVAGTAGSGIIPASSVWDRTNNILYICTTSGVAAAAVWTAVNASSATPAVTQPQGYLTLTSGLPVIASDVASATSVYYTPFTGNLVPIYNGATMIPTVFAELTLALASQHVLNSIYDVFVFSNSGVPTVVTGPAWSTITAGSGARGAGAGTTELQRVLGYWTNKVQITGRNGASTYTIAANLATYVGSIYIDGTAGQVTCHKSYGQSRKWGVWNAYNKQPILVQMGDSTATWTYSTAAFRQSNGAAGNTLATFSGLPETTVEVSALQRVQTSNSGCSGQIGVGLNVTNAATGVTIPWSLASAVSQIATVFGGMNMAPTIGINNINFLESGNGTVTMTYVGTSTTMLMTAKWLG